MRTEIGWERTGRVKRKRKKRGKGEWKRTRTEKE